MSTRYHYVGDQDLLDVGQEPPPRFHITSPATIRQWMRETHQRVHASGEIVATFAIDDDEQLWIADRHSDLVEGQQRELYPLDSAFHEALALVNLANCML